MSLKAKIEAVIYAAEEPITLAQLASIFADEALAAKTAAGLPFEVTQPDNGEAPASEGVKAGELRRTRHQRLRRKVLEPASNLRCRWKMRRRVNRLVCENEKPSRRCSRLWTS